MSKALLFVINPIAGDTSIETIERAIERWKTLQDRPIYVYYTQGENDAEAITQQINEQKIEEVVAVGGDGTFLQAAHICHKLKLPLGLIPAGSANGMAAELNIPDNPAQALRIIEKGHTIGCDMLCFNDKHLGIHISDMGLNARLVSRFEKSDRRGFLAYTTGIFDQITSLSPFNATFYCDGRKETHECLMVAFANARFYGTGAALNQQGKVNDGKFELCLLHGIGLRKLAAHFFDLVGEHSDHLTVHQCEKVVVETLEEVQFQIDGELMEPTKRVSVEIIPGAVNLMVPKQVQG